MIGEPHLRVAFFNDFNGSDTVLFAGNRNGMELLSWIARELAAGKTSIDLLTHRGVVTLFGMELTAYLDASDVGLRRRKPTGLDFAWVRDADGWLEVAEKVDALRDSQSGSGHAYLNAAHRGEPAVLMVSVGEYDEEWWARAADTLRDPQVHTKRARKSRT